MSFLKLIIPPYSVFLIIPPYFLIWSEHSQRFVTPFLDTAWDSCGNSNQGMWRGVWFWDNNSVLLANFVPFILTFWIKLFLTKFAFLLLTQYIYADAFNRVRVNPIFRLFRIIFLTRKLTTPVPVRIRLSWSFSFDCFTFSGFRES